MIRVAHYDADTGRVSQLSVYKDRSFIHEDMGPYVEVTPEHGASIVRTHKVVDGRLTARSPEEIPQSADPDWKRARRAAYPPIQDQLEALWKGGAAADAMRAEIAAIKAKYPKPASGS